MKFNIRGEARSALARAQVEMASASDSRLTYAALELRLAMEALTYDRAQAYGVEIAPEEYATWQPRKLMEMLLDIDPTADSAFTLGIGVEEESGTASPVMSVLGAESVLDLKALKAHYDALGSYLHLPTWRKLSVGGKHDLARLRERCQEIADLVQAALRSPVFNVTLGTFSDITCVRCDKPVRRRLPPDRGEVEARCFACGAPYLVRDAGDGRATWQPLQERVSCPVDRCNEASHIWRDHVKRGESWNCRGCGTRLTIRLCIAAGEPEESFP